MNDIDLAIMSVCGEPLKRREIVSRLVRNGIMTNIDEVDKALTSLFLDKRISYALGYWFCRRFRSYPVIEKDKRKINPSTIYYYFRWFLGDDYISCTFKLNKKKFIYNKEDLSEIASKIISPEWEYMNYDDKAVVRFMARKEVCDLLNEEELTI